MTLNLKHNQSRTRKYHFFMILSLIQKHGQITRTELAQITKMSHTTVGKIVKELMNEDLVIEVGFVKGEVGRKATLLEINPTGSYMIGVVVEVKHIEIAVVSLSGEVIERTQTTFELNERPQEILYDTAKHINTLIGSLNSKVSSKIIAVGVSIPGLVTWHEGQALMVPQFNWKNVQVKKILEEQLDYVVYVDNDVKAVLLGESLFGDMGKYNTSACIYVGSGVGGAVSINGEILRGQNNTLGEIGHMTLNPEGLLCDCGRHGCLQTYLCSTHLEKQAMMPIDDIFQSYNDREEWAVRLIDRAKRYLGITVANIVCMYNPEAILLAGPMIEKFPILTDGIEAIVNENTFSPLRDTFVLKTTDIGENNGTISASAVVLSEFLSYSNDEI